jgi:hypothetical protein
MNGDVSSTLAGVHGLVRMKPWTSWRPVPAALLALLFAWPLLAKAQTSFTIEWSAVAGGGGTSTGGVYSVSGTLGQPNAGGPLAGGNFSLTGGFWALYAVQTPGAPWLTIMYTATNSVVVSWPLPAEGWVLEWTNRVVGVSAPWPQVSLPCQTNTVQAWVVVPAPNGNQFYRLHKP